MEASLAGSALTIITLKPQAMVANGTVAEGIPAFRYFFNATIPSFLPQNLSWLGAFHGADATLIFTPPALGPPNTQQTFTLANQIRAIWAHFVKNPIAGPGWPIVDFPFQGQNEVVDIGVWGNIGDMEKGGILGILSHIDIDPRCALFSGVYSNLATITG
jgi:acetylcholinesterase